jgi:hypothetical protein
MKKNTFLLSLWTVFALLPTACSNDTATDPSVVVVAVVIDSVSDGDEDPNSLLLYNALNDGHGGDLFYAGVPSELVDKDGNTIAATDTQPGQLVEITYGGLVQYLYPPKYMDVSKIKVLGQAADDLYAIASDRATAWENQDDPESVVSPSVSSSAISLTAPLPLSRNPVTLADGKDCYVNIEMTEGSYSYFSAGGGSYGNNFVGSYQVRVFTEDIGSDQTDLYTAPILFEGYEPMTFGSGDSLGGFSLIFDDYNADGNPDFTLGQWGGSNGNVYKLFSVYPDGTVTELLIEAGPISIRQFDFSVQLDKMSDTSFSKVWYNNSVGESIKTVYEWKDEQFVVIGEEPV